MKRKRHVKYLIEECGSTKKLWKELNQGQRMLVNLGNRKGTSIWNKKSMFEKASYFYRRLYGRDNEVDTKDTEREERAMEENYEIFKIIGWEVESDKKI